MTLAHRSGEEELASRQPYLISAIVAIGSSLIVPGGVYARGWAYWEGKASGATGLGLILMLEDVGHRGREVSVSVPHAFRSQTAAVLP